MSTDVADPASSPHGVSYLPAPPPPDLEKGIQSFPEPIPTDFLSYIADESTNRAVLSSQRRSQMREILRNPDIQYSKNTYTDRNERGKLYGFKNWTLKHFELDDGQIYRKAEMARGTEYNRRYAACQWDAFELIAGVHRGLCHSGINKTHERAMELYYGITQGDVEWILQRCTVCNQNAANRAPSSVTPIISQRCLDRVYLDLMDFTSQPDGEYNWVLQIKDHFSRYVWLFALKDKGSEEVARCVSFWMSWCGCPKRFYADNGTEFEGELIPHYTTGACNAI